MASADHYFASVPAVASNPGSVTLTLPDRTLQLQTDRGVFSARGVDPGTKQLLLTAPMPAADSTHAILDLGCGYGPIACVIAARAPLSTVWAIDVNERALGLCQANADAAGLQNIRVSLPHNVAPDVAFDRIYGNPPIRIGKPALQELLTTWLLRLAPGGEANFVVQRHLGSDSLQRWLGAEGWDVTRSGSRAGYRLLTVHRQEATRPATSANGVSR